MEALIPSLFSCAAPLVVPSTANRPKRKVKTSGLQNSKRVSLDDLSDATPPDSRALARIICRVADDDAYTRSTALKTLKRLEGWACPATTNPQDLVKQSQYLHDLIEVGGCHILVHFLKDAALDHDEKCTQRALSVLSALLRSSVDAAAADNNAPLTKATKFVGQKDVTQAEASKALQTTKQQVATMLLKNLDLYSVLQEILDGALPSTALVVQHDALVVRKEVPVQDLSASRRQLATLGSSLRGALKIMGNSSGRNNNNQDGTTPTAASTIHNLLGASVASSFGLSSTNDSTLNHIFIVAATAVSGFEVVLDQALANVERYVGKDNLKALEISVLAAMNIGGSGSGDGGDAVTSKRRNTSTNKTGATPSPLEEEEAKHVTLVKALYAMALLISYIDGMEEEEEDDDDGEEEDVQSADDHKLEMLQTVCSAAHRIVLVLTTEGKDKIQSMDAVLGSVLSCLTVAIQAATTTQPLPASTARDFVATAVAVMKACLTNSAVARKGCKLFRLLLPCLSNEEDVKNLGVVAVVGALLASPHPQDVLDLADDVYETHCTKKKNRKVGTRFFGKTKKVSIREATAPSSESPPTSVMGGLDIDDGDDIEDDGDDDDDKKEDDSNMPLASRQSGHSDDTAAIANCTQDVSRACSF